MDSTFFLRRHCGLLLNKPVSEEENSGVTTTTITHAIFFSCSQTSNKNARSGFEEENLTLSQRSHISVIPSVLGIKSFMTYLLSLMLTSGTTSAPFNLI